MPMINKLTPYNQLHMRSDVIINKLNEIIDTVNKQTEQFEELECEPYCSQAEEALKQIAQLEKRFSDHVHYAREMQFPTSTPDNPNVFNDPR